MTSNRGQGLRSLVTGPPPTWGGPLVLALVAAAVALVQLPDFQHAGLGPGLLVALLAPLWLSRAWWISASVVIAAATATATPDYHPTSTSGAAGGGVLLCGLLAGLIVTVLVRQVHSAHSAVLRQGSDHDRAFREAQAQEEALRLQLAYASSHDGLTGLLDRAAFLEQLGDRLAGDAPMGVAVVSLSGFAELNDTMGSEVGDQVLLEVSGRLRGAARDSDLVSRLGGDVFAVLYPGITVDTAGALGIRMHEILREPIAVADRLLPLRTRVGIACTTGPGMTAAEVLRRGELTARGSAAGGPASIWEADAAFMGQNRVELEADLQRGLLAHEFHVLYQPLVSTTEGTITSVEALVRWQHPTRGLVPPDEFISIAERCGLIVPLGIFVLEQACQQLRVWAGTGRGLGLTVAVNVSARQLIEPDFVVKVRQVLFNSGVNPRQIVLELTESMLVDDSDAAVAVLWQLRALGVRLAIDDFGTGYSSLARLGEMPVDELKIDKSFVDRLGSHPHDSTALVTAAVAMGHGLSLEVVAEGVETQGQATFLASIGCDLLQGYLLGKPQPGGAITGQLGQRLFNTAVPGPRSHAVPAQDTGVAPVPGVAPAAMPITFNGSALAGGPAPAPVPEAAPPAASS